MNLMKRSSYFLQLFLGSVLLMLLLLAAVAWGAYRHLDGFYHAQSVDQQAESTRLAATALDQAADLTPETIDAICKALGKETATRFTVIAPSGMVLGDSDADPAEMENHVTADRSRPEIRSALEAQAPDEAILGRSERISDTLGVTFRYQAVPLWREGELVAVVRTAMPMADIVADQAFLKTTLVVIAIGSIGLTAMMALMLSAMWYWPLRRVTVAAERLASGDLSRPVRVGGSRELLRVGTSLDQMRQRLLRKVTQVISQRADFAAVVGNLEEAVIALDDRGRIVLANASAQRFFGVAPDMVDTRRALTEATRNPGLLGLIEQYGRVGKAVHGRVTLVESQDVLELLVAPIRGEGDGLKTLIVARDITDQVRTAAVKAEFAANASHELRTPLTAMRMAMETLKDISPEDIEEQRDVLSVLDRHIGRLEGLCQDLLDLHWIESDESKVVVECMDADQWLEQLRLAHEQIALDGDVMLRTLQAPTLTTFTCDRKLLGMIADNLLSNALKFTPAGGRVTVELVGREEDVLLIVRDTGCGISLEDQRRVFDRFYQGVPSRTGDPSVRGTGLGLAIVKHAVEQLGGKVELVSQVGQGTTLTVYLPQGR